MARLVESSAAAADLESIADYIATDSVSAADRWLDSMRAVFRLIAAQSGMGEALSTRRFGVIRRHSHGRYVIYFRVVAGDVEILRVLHGARDQDRHLD